ncbi:hypothetical protein LCGC14_2533360 [marine sediment metagenome]|uniref:Uncharacterized protein n=1 Tax=marine sediment metagenome TaxID=412755 RepID=A0A0F9ASV3_9ZZZZ
MIRLWLRRLCGVLMIVVGGVVCCLLLGLVLPVLAVCGTHGSNSGPQTQREACQ